MSSYRIEQPEIQEVFGDKEQILGKKFVFIFKSVLLFMKSIKTALHLSPFKKKYFSYTKGCFLSSCCV